LADKVTTWSLRMNAWMSQWDDSPAEAPRRKRIFLLTLLIFAALC